MTKKVLKPLAADEIEPLVKVLLGSNWVRIGVMNSEGNGFISAVLKAVYAPVTKSDDLFFLSEMSLFVRKGVLGWLMLKEPKNYDNVYQSLLKLSGDAGIRIEEPFDFHVPNGFDPNSITEHLYSKERLSPLFFPIIATILNINILLITPVSNEYYVSINRSDSKEHVKVYTQDYDTYCLIARKEGDKLYRLIHN